MEEVFRRFNDRIEGSNLGNIKKDGKLIEPCHGDPYDYITFNRKMERVHIIIATLFPEICGTVVKWGHVHHKNRNQRDNRAENLICMTRSEHKRIHQKEDGVSVPVKAYDKEGNKVGEWDSMEEASKKTGVHRRHISHIISRKERRFTAGGYYWFRADETEEKIFQKISSLQQTKYQRFRKKMIYFSANFAS